VRDHLLRTLQGDGDRAVSWAEETNRKLVELPDHAKPVTEQELLACNMPGLSLGAHTVTHANLPTLSENAVRGELAESKQWLQSRTDRYVDWLAYPYGYHDDAVVRVAAEVFSGALRVDGGLFSRKADTNPHRVPRINVPRGLSLDGLLLRLSGLIT
jgi:peptidoglycan/xylan/chitin deacetylase (PgdA/CDA1 family)